MGKRTTDTPAAARLREILRPGDTVHTVVRHVSRSGMSRTITFHVVADNGIRDITLLAGKALGLRVADDGGLKIAGCGMDTAFATVYDLSSVLFRDGFVCTGDRCPSNDHSNGDRDRTPHVHSDPGYALRQERV